jgi:hypothetical protein
MARHVRKVLITVAGIAALALGGATLASAGSGSSSTQAPAAATAPQTTPSTQADGAGQESGAQAKDVDQVQSGDQTTPDAAGEQAGSETPNGDGPGGHADEPGNQNADHQFQGQE